MISAALADEIEEKMRPVGQVVKTEASHAFNIGSNPVRVTTFFSNLIGRAARAAAISAVGAD